MKTSLGTIIFTRLFGKFIGKDQFDNRYYRRQGNKVNRQERRWVIYNGDAEGSAVPSRWQAWLTHTITDPPIGESSARKTWMIEHRSNPTGTSNAYSPPGALEKGNSRPSAIGDYEPWLPDRPGEDSTP